MNLIYNLGGEITEQPGPSNCWFGQIIATSRDLGPQKVVEEGKSPFFKEI